MKYRVLSCIVLLVLFAAALQAQDEPDCTAVLEIWQIQGSGDVAHCVDQTIITEDNVVTSIALNGFFIQTPDDRIDGNPLTSDGIFVYTNAHPVRWGIAVGDLVNLSVRVRETYSMTELHALRKNRVDVLSSGNAVPEPVDLTTAELTMVAGAPHPLERYEGMLVTVQDVEIIAPTNHFDEFAVTLNGERAFREPGIETDDMPDLTGLGLAEFDLNAEVLEIDMGATTLPVAQVASGGRATVTGGLAYSYLDYQIWPSEVIIAPVDFQARPVRTREAGEFTIGTLNTENLFDTIDEPLRQDGPGEDYTPLDEAQYNLRLDKTAEYIVSVMQTPDIIALQEVENIRVLTHLAQKIYVKSSISYAACLLEGNEGRGIDVGYLWRVDRVNVDDCYRMPGTLEGRYNDGDFLFTRPPLILEAQFLLGDAQSFPITMINVHNRSLSDVELDRVQLKRMLQATTVAEYVQQLQIENPDIHLAVVGDFNAFQFTDGLVDVVGIITGNHDPSESLTAPEDVLVEPNLVSALTHMDAGERYSYIWNGSVQVLDHALLSSALDAVVSGAQYGRGNADAPPAWMYEDTGAVRTSDHDGLVVYIKPE